MNNAGTLYRLDFASGKSYVGVTTKTAHERFADHQKTVSLGGPWAVYQAWRKYGTPKLVVLAIVSRSVLKIVEQRAVAAFGTFAPHGYNMTPGGDFNPMDVPEIRAKHLALMSGPDCPTKRPEVRAKWSGDKNAMRRPEVVAKCVANRKPGNEKLRGRKRPEHSAFMKSDKSPMRGKTHTIEAREKMAAAKRGKLMSLEARAKMSAAGKGRPKSIEHRRKISASNKITWAAKLKKDVL